MPPCGACRPDRSAPLRVVALRQLAVVWCEVLTLLRPLQAHWPTGPALDDKFWLYMITWHIGLFLAMFLGQIGVQARKQGYFD